MSKVKRALVGLCLFLGGAAHAGPLGVSHSQFVTPDGKPIVLRGINVAQASKFAPYLPPQSKADFANIARWGCNCIRYLILWSGIEPTAGQYDDAYLAEVRKRLDWAKEAGLYVVLDMHQDVYGVKYGFCGAPDWACVDGGAKYGISPGEHWATNYLKPAVMAAFDSFWKDTPAPDGVGVQTHFIRAWRHVIQKLGDHPAVIGYDLLNEPFYGNVLLYPETFAAFAKMQKLLPGGMSPMSLFSGKRTDVVQRFLADPTKFYPAIDCADAAIKRFETERLMPFYKRAIGELRQLTPDAIFFVEPHIWASGGAHAFLSRDGIGGEAVRLAYAAHYYDPGCSPDIPYDGQTARARQAFERVREAAKRLDAPVFLGEWGDAESPASTAERYLGDQAQLLREFGFSHCYWDDSADASKKPVFGVLRSAWQSK